MAIYIEGKTLCPLCGQPVEPADSPRTVAFSYFVPNELDPLYIFNDAVFHTEHFDAHPLHDAALARLAERERRQAAHTCYISGTEAVIENYKNPANLIFTDWFTDDPADSLHEYNYRYLNKYYFEQWPERQRFLDAVEQLDVSGRWRGPYLRQLLRQLTSPLQPAWSSEMQATYKQRFETEHAA